MGTKIDLAERRDKPARTPDWVVEFNKRHAVVSMGGKTLVMTEGWNPSLNRRTITFSTFDNFAKRYSNEHPLSIGGKEIQPAKAWLRHPRREQYDGIGFWPGQEAPEGWYNTWRGWGVEPNKEGSCALFLEHVLTVWCGGDSGLNEYVLDWMAHLFQHPMDLPGVALVVQGKRGTGKSIIAQELGALLGEHYTTIAGSKRLAGRFNAPLANKLLVLGEECFWAGDREAESTLKPMLTGATIAIEHKGVDPIELRNCLRLIVCTNAAWAVPAGLEERRFCVLSATDAHIQDHAYFAAMANEMDRGGRGALLIFFLNRKITREVRQAPKTLGLLDQIEHTLSPVDSWWLAKLKDGILRNTDKSWPDYVTTEDMYSDFVESSRRAGIRRPGTSAEFGRRLMELCPGIQKRRARAGQERPYVYYLPDLGECREAFENLLRVVYPWRS